MKQSTLDIIKLKAIISIEPLWQVVSALVNQDVVRFQSPAAGRVYFSHQYTSGVELFFKKNGYQAIFRIFWKLVGKVRPPTSLSGCLENVRA